VIFIVWQLLHLLFTRLEVELYLATLMGSKISPLELAWGMVGVGLIDVGMAFLLILIFFILLEGKFNLKNKEGDFSERLDVIEDSLKVVAAVLQQLPDLVPKFEIQNNPLSQILEFITQIRNSESDSSIDAPLLRDGEGRFTDGEKEV